MNNFLTRLAGQAIGVALPNIKPDLHKQIPEPIYHNSEEANTDNIVQDHLSTDLSQISLPENNILKPKIAEEKNISLKNTLTKIKPRSDKTQMNQQSEKKLAKIQHEIHTGDPVVSKKSSQLNSSPNVDPIKSVSSNTNYHINQHNLVTNKQPLTQQTKSPQFRSHKSAVEINTVSASDKSEAQIMTNTVHIAMKEQPPVSSNTKYIIKNNTMVDKNNKNEIGSPNDFSVPTKPSVIINKPNVYQPSTIISKENSRQESTISKLTENSSPNIRIEIGKIEVRAKTPPQPIAKPSFSSRQAKLSLNDYLKQRNKGVR